MKQTPPNFNYSNNAFFIVMLLLALTLLFSGCRSHRPAQLPPVQLRDSIRVEVRERVVTIHDTAYIEVPAQSQSQQVRDSTSHLETDFAESDARINADGSLSHSLRNKPQQLAAPTENKVHVRDSVVYRDREVPVPQPYAVEKPLTLWQKLLMNAGAFALGSLLLLLIVMVVKIVKKVKD